MIEFRRLNLVQPLPNLGTFDLILCRNFLIYLDEATRRRLCQGLYQALNPGGILMIGAAESIYGVTDAFSTERVGNTFIHRKTVIALWPSAGPGNAKVEVRDHWTSASSAETYVPLQGAAQSADPRPDRPLRGPPGPFRLPSRV